MELCKHVETKFVPAGAILFRPGQMDDSIYVVRNGRLEVFVMEVVSVCVISHHHDGPFSTIMTSLGGKIRNKFLKQM